MVTTYPLFALTLEEQASFQTDLDDLILEIDAILHPETSHPLSVYDWSEALRLVRDAFVLATDMHECGDQPPEPGSPSSLYSSCSSCASSPVTPHPAGEPDSHARLATLFLAKGDCLRGLGRVREARDAYQAALAASEEVYGPATTRLAVLDRAALDDVRARRMGGLWTATHVGCGGLLPDLAVLGYETELWDPEPSLKVQCAERWARHVEVPAGTHLGLRGTVARFVRPEVATVRRGGKEEHHQHRVGGGAGSPRMIRVSA